MDYTGDEEKFEELLNNEYEWPAKYTFKFIVPAGKEDEVKALFEGDIEVKEKGSSGGKYTSTTIYVLMPNAEAIIAIYESASNIEGIISL